MNITKILKATAIIGGLYVTAELSYAFGKGQMLKLVKEHELCDSNVDELLDGLSVYPKHKLTNKIIVSVATSER